MKLFFSEYKVDYPKYHFPYQVLLSREDDDDIDKIFDMGFLPSRSKLNLFYLARSIRVNLSKLEPSSENRRILRKTEYLNLEVKDLKEFDYDYTMGKLGKDFYEKRFGKGVMSAFRIKWLFTSGSCSHVLVYKDPSASSGQCGDMIVGYCPVVKTDKLMHYAYPFYDVRYFEKNAGMGMMLKAILHAKESGLDYVYLGTCYTEKSLYKTQFEGVEYFTGFSWSDDIEKLKELIRSGVNGHLLEKLEDKEEVFKTEGITF
jgi:arginyl-tRNA--protein-N-Asp/Glu arginylyltransferase